LHCDPSLWCIGQPSGETTLRNAASRPSRSVGWL